MWYTQLLAIAGLIGGSYLGNKYSKLSSPVMAVLNTAVAVGAVWSMKYLGLM